MIPNSRLVGVKISVRLKIEEDEGRFFATIPSLPGLIVDGKNIKQIEKRLPDLLFVHLSMMAKYNEPLPVGEDLTIEFIMEEPEEQDQVGVSDGYFTHFGNPTLPSEKSEWRQLQWDTQNELVTS